LREKTRNLPIQSKTDTLPSMPLFEFFCEDCEENSELLVRSGNGSSEECSHCGSTRLEKQLSRVTPMGGSAEANLSAGECTGNPGACGMCN